MAGTNFFTPISPTCYVALTEGLDSSFGIQNAMLAMCSGTPPTTAGVFEPSCLMQRIDTGHLYQNTGSLASPSWTLFSGTVPALTSAHIFVGNGSNAATDVAMSGDVHIDNTGATTIQANAVTTTKILNANVTLAKLAAGITPTEVVKFSGKITWSGSGASLATTVAGVASTDIVMATIQGAPTQAAYLVSAAPTTNTITLVLSAANTSNDAVIAYTVFRAAS